MGGLILGAYAAAPADLSKDVDAEQAWYSYLRAQSTVRGLELAWDGGLHPAGVDTLTALLSPEWSSVVTMMSGTSTRLLVDGGYGLASEVSASRETAVQDAARAHAEIMHVRESLGRHAIIAVELPSAPSALNAPVSAEALCDSLCRILEWDWEDVLVVVEHCDSAAGPSPQKGFLSLEDEIVALHNACEGSVVSTGHTVNWARSTIESQDPATPARHLDEIVRRAHLGGLMFSGASPQNTVFGGAWMDAHLPVAGNGPGMEHLSLLTVSRIRDAVAVGGTPQYIGVKVSAPKLANIPLLDRLAPGLATVNAVLEVMSE